MQQSTDTVTHMLCPHCFAQLNTQGKCPVCGYNVAEMGVLDQNKLAPATILKGRYYIGLPLGQGGFGITYLSYDLMLNIKLAIKEYYPSGIATRIEGSKTVTNISQKDLTDFREGLEKFLGEARTLAKFSEHQNIVSVRDYFEYNGTAYMVMGYLEGQTLLQYLDSCGGKLSFADTCRFMFPIMEALNAVHASGLIHRDISPDNVFITNDGAVKLLDFGAAKSALALVAQQKHSIVLKKGYSPSEQYREDGQLGPWTDIYSMGATFYRCLTGEVPQDSIDRLFNDKVIELKNKAKDAPNYAVDAILKAMSLNEVDRFQNMLDFKEALIKKAEVSVKPQPKKMTQTASQWVEKQPASVQPQMASVMPKASKQGNGKIIVIAVIIFTMIVACGLVLFNTIFNSDRDEVVTVAEQKTVAAEPKTENVKKPAKGQDKPIMSESKDTPVAHAPKKIVVNETQKPQELKIQEKKTTAQKRQDTQTVAKKTTAKSATQAVAAKAINAAHSATVKTATATATKAKTEQTTVNTQEQKNSVTAKTVDIQSADAKKRREENLRKLQQENAAAERARQQSSAADEARKRREENLRKMKTENGTETTPQNSTNDAAKKRREENLRKLQQEQ